MSPDKRRLPVKDHFQSHITSLTKEALTARPTRAEKAYQRLVKEVSQKGVYDPVLDVVRQAQRHALSSSDIQIKNTAIVFLGRFIRDVRTDTDETTLSLNNQTVPVINEVVKNAQYLQDVPAIQFASNYERLVSELLPSIQERFGKAPKVIITFAKRLTDEETQESRDLARRERNAWMQQIDDLIEENTEKTDHESPPIRDRIITLLRDEPQQTIFREKKLFTSEYAGLSMAKIEDLPYPPSAQDIDRINDYVIGILSDNPSYQRQRMISNIFFQPTIYRMPNQTYLYANTSLFNRISRWQEALVYNIYYPGSDEAERKIQDILQLLPPYAIVGLSNSIYFWATHPVEVDPDYDRGPQDRTNTGSKIYWAAINTFLETTEYTDIFMYGDEIAQNHFVTTGIPHLKERLVSFGVLDKFQKYLDTLSDEIVQYTFSKEHIDAMKGIFQANCGDEFLEKLNTHAKDIEDVTATAWQLTGEKGGPHFKPMEMGNNIIEFTEGSVENMLGISSLKVQSVGSNDDWTIAIAFALRNTYLTLLGALDQNGKLMLKGPLEDEIPGLYRMLNHIAVLSYHDLVVQHIKETHYPTPGKKPKVEGEDKPKKEEKPGIRKSHRGSLPRVQTDRQLVSDVYTKTGFTQRRVELHKQSLPYAKNYKDAISLYYAAQESQDPQELEVAKELLDQARKQARKITTEKEKSIPARFSLEAIADPIIQEQRYLQTWVIEHTSPKPTKEELQSPVKMFERYYKHSSALASLDQMKPWFIGTT